MSKVNFIEFSEAALKETEGTYAFTTEYKESILDSETSTYKIEIGKGSEFVGDETGNTYTVDEIGKRSDEDGLLKGASIEEVDTKTEISIDSSLTAVKRINNLGLAAEVNTDNAFEIPETVEYIEDGALAYIKFATYSGEDETILASNGYGVQYFNAVEDSDTKILYKDSDKEIIYGLGDAATGTAVAETILTIPVGVEAIYSFDGEKKTPFLFDKTVISKIVLPVALTSITAQINAASDITISYDSVDYTAAGTGYDDSYTDLNAKLVSGGICAEGFDFIVTVE